MPKKYKKKKTFHLGNGVVSLFCSHQLLQFPTFSSSYKTFEHFHFVMDFKQMMAGKKCWLHHRDFEKKNQTTLKPISWFIIKHDNLFIFSSLSFFFFVWFRFFVNKHELQHAIFKRVRFIFKIFFCLEKIRLCLLPFEMFNYDPLKKY